MPYIEKLLKNKYKTNTIYINNSPETKHQRTNKYTQEKKLNKYLILILKNDVK